VTPTAVVAGSIAQKPGRGGHAWVFLQYILGLARLGFNIVFMDRLDPSAFLDSDGRSCPPERSVGVAWLARIMRGFGLGEAWAVLGPGGRPIAGMSSDDLAKGLDRSALLLNINGFLTEPDLLDRVPRRVFLDIDPGFPQMWQELGLHDSFVGHDDFVTVGANIGRPGCEVPTCGVRWIPTRPPVVLEHWTPEAIRPSGSFTSVATWRGAYGPVEYRGRKYGPRAHEFRKFADVPRRSGGRFVIALDIHPDDSRDIELLESGGWSLIDPRAVAGDPGAYRDFVRRSAAEFTVAKGMYVQSRGGWFSDRSACYLASGRPVLAQDTGLESQYPTGKGLVLFETPEDAIRGVEEIRSDYEGHARAARRLAEEFFDSDIVLSELLSSLQIG
jgi:hypothetical protein